MGFIRATLLVAIGLASKVAAHGHIRNCTVNGNMYLGYNPMSPTRDTDQTVGWKIPEDTDNGYVDFTQLNSPDIICHRGATPGDLSITVKPGDVVECHWQNWPISHHGPVFNYLANCNGDCVHVDKHNLKFNKIFQEGLVHPDPRIPIGANFRTKADPKTSKAGYWGADLLRDEGETFKFEVPKTIADGYYVLRQEKIGMHDAMDGASGAQPIPQCINLQVTESTGHDEFKTGTLGVDLYNKDEPGFHVDIFYNIASYQCPGIPLYDGSGSTDTPSGGGDTMPTPTPTPTTTPTPTPTPTVSQSPTFTPSLNPVPYTSHPYSAPKHYSASKHHSGPKPHPAPKPYSAPNSYNTGSSGGNDNSGAGTSDTKDSTSYDTDSSGGNDSSGVGTSDTKDSTVPSSTGSNSSFPDLTKLSIGDLLNLIEKIISALRAKLGQGRNHARDLIRA